VRNPRGTVGNGTGPANLCGRVEIDGHVIFASHSREEWSVVVNGVTIDHLTNRFAALEMISRLAQALRASIPTGLAGVPSHAGEDLGADPRRRITRGRQRWERESTGRRVDSP
jgi:hypothetical protein